MPSANPPVTTRIADARRAALVDATLDLVAEGGLPAATLRAVAARAGVTNGLIRHYFRGKDALMVAAYTAMIARMVEPARAVLTDAGASAGARLEAFLEASLVGGVGEPALIRQWAAFLGSVHVDPAMGEVHRDGYLGFRRAIEPLVAELRPDADPDAVAAMATRLNAMIDGLWLEAALLPGVLGSEEVMALARVGARQLLGLPA